eukprot:CAMPEP_0117048886 /NCGR_PEP_ID=MMETSP0472-20121206/33797_1 /TAXON_ID=693140 ORGANISM="Tiarina fusus, Strain LIS" /NCGR_SAMPLE_ID=MMETSP0472 /ASSEMBLY_ACC=CAM_ASM_000603 /LENGTH=61 /DNA_ID=CAMNT_0004762165 /DNA_START=339 /DNA_END=524 /DNA_ORIENTATION=+
MYLSGFAFFHGIVMWRIVKLYDQFDKNYAEVRDNSRGLPEENDKDGVKAEEKVEPKEEKVE